jgi:AcrR family transcriptional regulator
MDRVASQVGVATGSLYNYFQGKDEFLRFFYTRLVEPFLWGIEEAAKTDLPAPKELEAILREASKEAIEHKGLIRLLAGIDHDAEVRKNVRPRLLQALTAIFERGIEEGSFHPHNAAHTARLFLGCMTELFELLVSGASDDEVEQFAQLLINTSVYGVVLHATKGRKPGKAGPAPSTRKRSTAE